MPWIVQDVKAPQTCAKSAFERLRDRGSIRRGYKPLTVLVLNIDRPPPLATSDFSAIAFLGLADVLGSYWTQAGVLVAGACNVQNALVVPFRVELIRATV